VPRRRPLLLAALVALGLAACGPLLAPPGGPKHSFVVIVHNLDVAYAETATVTWWVGSAILGSETKLMPAGGWAAFPTGGVPDGFEIDALAWPPGSGAVWGRPDYRSTLIFHVAYPTRFTWKDPYPVR